MSDWVIVTETEEGIIVPNFRAYGPFESWSDASSANAAVQGEIVLVRDVGITEGDPE
jgi:hypothetical protein